MSDFKFESHLDEVLKEIEKAKKKKMVAAGEYARSKIIEKLSGEGTGRAYYVPGTKTTYTASSPGDPPAQATGQLRESIDYTFDGPDVIVGTPLKYGPRLEFGYRGTDALGRIYNQAPRPFLRPTLKEEEKTLMKIMRGRWFD